MIKLLNFYFNIMYDLIAIGSIRVDLYFKGSSFTIKDGRFFLANGGKYFAENLRVGVGGGAANIAAGLAHFGYRTAAVAKVGGVFKQIIHDNLTKKNISSEFLQEEKDFISVSAVVLSPSGERMIISHNTDMTDLLNESMFHQLKKSKAVFFSNLYQIPLHMREKTADFLKKNWVKVLVNLGVKDCRRPSSEIKKYLEKIDHLFLNCHEFADLVRVPYEKIDFKYNVVQKYLPFFKNILVLTDGANGSYGYRGGEVFYQEAIKPRVIVDTTGAGDGYTCGFIAEYLKNEDMEKSMLSGANYAAHILGKLGAN